MSRLLKTVLFAAALTAALPARGPAQPGAYSLRGRLFTTLDERRRLDALRRHPNTTDARRFAAKSARLRPRARVEVEGVVVRSGGPDTVWVNGDNTLRGARIAGGLHVSRAAAGAAARVVMPDRQAVILRPGQAYEPGSGITSGIRVTTSQ